MKEIRNLLKEREKYLCELKSEKERELKTAPEGLLRVCNSRNRIQYYHRTDPKDFNGVYIKEKDIHLAQGLAQKDYDQRILRAIEKELECIRKYFTNYPERNVEQVLEGLHKERQRFIHPIRETDEQYIQNWRNVAYEGKGFAEDAPEFYTSRGERVRSKSEWIIAELLEKEGIPYRYEYPVYLRGFGKVYPDFTVLNVRTRKEIYWEHMGMMDNPIYAEKAVNKIHTYEQNGMFQGEDLLVTYETSKSSLNQKVIMRMIQRYLK